MKKLSNSEAQLKKSVAYKRSVYQSENHLKRILFEDLNYPRLTELATPFGDLVLKVADFQFKYLKKMQICKTLILNLSRNSLCFLQIFL